MLQEIRNTTKHSAIYAFGNAATKIIGIILIPIYTDPQFLSQADFGALAILEAMAQVLTGVFAMAMSGSLHRWYWDKDYVHIQKRVFFTSYAFLLGMNIPVFALLLYLSPSLSSLVFSTLDFTYLVRLTVVTVGFRILNNQVLALYKLQSKSRAYTTVQVLKLIVVLFLTIWFVTRKGKGLEGIWEASLIGEFLVFILLLPTVFRNIEWKFDTKILKEMFIYGYPLMLSSVAVTLLTVTDRFMLKFLSGLESTAVYALGLRIANTLNIVITASIQSALAPIRMKKMNEPGNGRFYAKALLYVGLLFTYAVLALSLFSLEILKIFTNSTEYWAAVNIIPILSFALLFTSLRYNANIGLVIKKKTKIIALLIFITTLFNMGLNFLLIPVLDLYGASLATLISQLILFVSVAYASQRYFRIPYEWGKVLIMVLTAAVLIVAGLFLGPVDPLIRIPLKLLLLVIFPLILVGLGFFEKVEMDTIKKIISVWRKPGELRKNINRLLGD